MQAVSGPYPDPTAPAAPPAWPPRQAAVRPGGDPWPVVAAALIGVWAVVLTVGGQGVGWVIDQVLLAVGLDRPGWLWPLVAVVNASLVGLPAAPLATIPRSPAVRATGRAWLLGAVALGGFGLLRGVPAPLHEWYLTGLAAVAAGAAVLVRLPHWTARATTAGPAATTAGPAGRAAGPGVDATTAVGFAVAAGILLLLPWAWLGALGGALETVLAMAAAAAVGWFAAGVLRPGFWTVFSRPGRERPGSGAASVLIGGLVAGVTLTLIAGGLGHGGAQLAALLALPPTGFALAALRPLTRNAGGGAAVGALVGLGALGPLAFVDPEEISIVLTTGRDLPFWVTVAAVAAFGVAAVVDLGYGFGLARSRSARPQRWVAAGCAAVALVATSGVYLGLGQPGLYGERLFVVLRSQADLAGIIGEPGPVGRAERAGEVYRRLVTTAEESQADLRRALDRFGLDYTPYYLVNAIEVDGGPAVRAWLSRRGDVDRVLLSQRLRPLPAAGSPGRGDADPPTVPPWNIRMVGADRVRTELGVDGSGIVVGSSDSGVDGTHPALAGGFRGGDDSWFDPWNDTRSPTDGSGHGTHTLGTAVGDGEVGVAPGASWVGCVNLDRNLGNPARYLDCLQFMLAPFPAGGDPLRDGRPERSPQVLTNSWGCPAIEGCDRDALLPATAAFAAAGIFFVAAAGNTGPFCGSIDDPPAPYADVFSVGAVDSERQVTFFSSRGPAAGGAVKPDVVAPGAGVLSAMPGGGYGTEDGTSMAAPHVAGVVALMWSANPSLVGDLERTRAILRDTAGPVAGAESTGGEPEDCGDPANVEGAGLVDGYAAVLAALRTTGAR